MEEYKLLKDQLIKLRLKTINNIFAEKAAGYRKNGLDYIEYLADLINEEVMRKDERSISSRIRSAKFPQIKTFDEFNFDYNKNISKQLISSFMNLAFISNAENIIFIGPPGVGKTHLSIATGIKACMSGIRTLFISAHDLINELNIAKLTKSLPDYIARLSKISLLIIDELGYLPMNADDANLFFQLVSRRYEKSSVIITTNKPFNEWGDIFKDDIIAAAILDRLVHHCSIVKITGKSYRLKDKSIDSKKVSNIINSSEAGGQN